MLNAIRPVARRVLIHRSTAAVRGDALALAAKCSRSARVGRWDDSEIRPFSSRAVFKQDATPIAEALQPESIRVISPRDSAVKQQTAKLPTVCPGCGAHSQTIDAESAGYYGSKRAAKASREAFAKHDEDEIFEQALKSGALSEVPNDATSQKATQQTAEIPICDRCHYLLYQSRGTSIIHPSMQSIKSIIEESPHKHNHIYHILDAADFPMSLIPNLQHALKLPRLRTQNRRSKTIRYLRGRVAEISFIITRSDLLAPKKEQVDSLVPYLREVLRDTLGKSGVNVRLGNVRCVSAKRGWWTKTVKEDIWSRGGAGWMVGKVNVGKSALYEVVFPKGRGKEVDVDVKRIRDQEQRAVETSATTLVDAQTTLGSSADEIPSGAFADSSGDLTQDVEPLGKQLYDPDSFQEAELETNSLAEDADDEPFLDEHEDASLLPPAQAETAYPRMPLVSSLPGTTASPIRIPFGNGKGELIDLPGIERSTFDSYIQPEHRKDLVMKSRVVPEQYTVKPGQSILVGGVVRITPRNEELVFLAYPFVPMKVHVTSTEKAVAIQTGHHEDGEAYSGTVENIATDLAKTSIAHAGTFQLEWDVTKRRAGPLTAKAAGKQKASNLPFVIYSTDILIESVGWVELVCQVRRRDKSFITESVSDAFGEGTVRKERLLEVEVWSPEGKCIGSRRPMNAWVLGGPKKTAKREQRGRPRQTVSMARRREGGAAGQKRGRILSSDRLQN